MATPPPEAGKGPEGSPPPLTELEEAREDLAALWELQGAATKTADLLTKKVARVEGEVKEWRGKAQEAEGEGQTLPPEEAATATVASCEAVEGCPLPPLPPPPCVAVAACASSWRGGAASR